MSDILTHIDAGVMTITFNRLDKKNSITGDMYAAMAQAVDQAQADPAIRVLVIQGHESIFSAGNDIGDFLNKPPSTVDSPVFHFMRALTTFEKPAIAAVAGPAVGIGTTLLFHCDLVYAGDNAAFSMPFVNLGLCPEFASSLLAPQMFGYHRAAEALLLGEAFFAEAALEIGLVNRVVPPTEVNGYQAFDEGRSIQGAHRTNGRRRSKFSSHAHRACSTRGIWRFHGKTQARLL
jgi:enoyl-CoA hydratase/carnithine racemase